MKRFFADKTSIILTASARARGATVPLAQERSAQT